MSSPDVIEVFSQPQPLIQVMQPGQGPVGPPGPQGPASPAISGLMFFTYNSNVNEPPTGSQIRMDNVSQPAVTKIWVTKVTNDGVDVTAWLFLMGIDGNELYLQDKDDYAKRQWFFLTGDAVDKGGYFELPVVWDRGHAPLPTQALVMVLQGQVARDAVT